MPLLEDDPSMWNQRINDGVRRSPIITPGAKHHYGGIKRRGSKKQKKAIARLYRSAARAAPTDAQVAELVRLGLPLNAMPDTRLAAAHLLRDLKTRKP